MIGSSKRLSQKLSDLKDQNRGGLITFTTAGDPDYETSLKILKGLPKAGADIIEIGMPFSDPMADGPAIQAASLRALKQGQTLAKTLMMIEAFRSENQTTPIILMGYANPIHTMGYEVFLDQAQKVGVDGLIIVDVPPEEDGVLYEPTQSRNMDFIRLVTPTSDDERLQLITSRASGFLYYVSVMGITGTKSSNVESVEKFMTRLRQYSDLPVAVGFGIRTPEQVKAFTTVAEAAVVGSAIVEIIENNQNNQISLDQTVADVLDFVGQLSGALK